ncbi:hypothetical protein DVK08_13000 [Halorubrum sp. Atlit-9R]|nr:hypothetical protein DVK08_13000 [Halorubrum sp. Atlit-9R]
MTRVRCNSVVEHVPNLMSKYWTGSIAQEIERVLANLNNFRPWEVLTVQPVSVELDPSSDLRDQINGFDKLFSFSSTLLEFLVADRVNVWEVVFPRIVFPLV